MQKIASKTSKNIINKKLKESSLAWEKTEISRFSGAVKLTVYPLNFQKKIRNEWA
jgi:hypothetical protein